jgi:signal transduction histidine kinase
MAQEPNQSTEEARHAFAALLEADRSKILTDYLEALEASGSSVARDAEACRQAMAHADQTVTDIVQSLRAGRVQVDEHAVLAREIGASRAATAVPTQESWSAAMLFAETVVHSITRLVDTDALDLVAIVLLTLNRSITVRIREATGAYTRYLLSRIHEAHIGERRRLARELHDRIGNGLSVAHRQLELFQETRLDEPVKALTRAEKAHEAVLESMHSLRAVISDLRREESLKSLEKALANYLDSIPPGEVTASLRVHGDEIWVPPMVRDESFLIVREAVRNALAHGAPKVIAISVEIAPHEMLVVVRDDGRGFAADAPAKPGATGLASMRERAALLGGVVTVHSRPGGGTQVELNVPLPDQREDAELDRAAER